MTIDARRTTVWLLVTTAVLTGLSLAAEAYVLSRDQPIGLAAERIVALVDLDAEANAPTFFSVMLLAAAALLLALIFRHHHADGRHGAAYWGVLALLFAGLSFDEAVSLHETMIGPFRRLFPDNRFVYFGWVVPGAIFVLVVGASFLRFLVRLHPRLRNRFIVAGAVYVGGALGVEVIEGVIASDIGEENWTYVSALTVQEVMEMVGVILFIGALLDHLRSLTAGIDVTWSGEIDRRSGEAAAISPRPG